MTDERRKGGGDVIDGADEKGKEHRAVTEKLLARLWVKGLHRCL